MCFVGRKLSFRMTWNLKVADFDQFSIQSEHFRVCFFFTVPFRRFSDRLRSQNDPPSPPRDTRMTPRDTKNPSWFPLDVPLVPSGRPRRRLCTIIRVWRSRLTPPWDHHAHLDPPPPPPCILHPKLLCMLSSYHFPLVSPHAGPGGSADSRGLRPLPPTPRSVSESVPEKRVRRHGARERDRKSAQEIK